MAAWTDDTIVDRLLSFEGGYVNDPADHGGPTNFVLTAADLGRQRKLGRPCSAAEVQAMQRSEAVNIYKTLYIDAPGFAKIDDGYLRLVVVDSGVLFGTARATKWLQQTLHVVIDGTFGDRTVDALKAVDAFECAKGVLSLRIMRIGDIVTKDPTQLKFLAGWLNRASNLMVA